VSDAVLLARIRAIHRTSRGTYGAPRIHAEFVEDGWRIGRKRVARLMREAGLCGVSRRKWVTTTRRRADARPAPDLVERDFTVAAPYQLYVVVITYVPTCLHASGGRAGDGQSFAHRAGAGCAEHGFAQATTRQCHPSFGSGYAI
jgi:transposase InsO family protein